MAQIEIWALPNQPLRQSIWLKHGYTSLKDYVLKEQKGHKNHKRIGCGICQKMSTDDLVSFGKFDPETGEKIIERVCTSFNDLPTDSIKDILIFD